MKETNQMILWGFCFMTLYFVITWWHEVRIESMLKAGTDTITCPTKTVIQDEKSCDFSKPIGGCGN